MKVSVVVTAYNEERKIEECLKSVAKIAHEIILVDSSSEDKTVEIAKKYTDKIFERENNPMLNINKNFGFTKAKGEWILNLDADERVTDELSVEIDKLQADADVNGYLIPRQNIIFGKWIRNGIWWPDYQLRLFRRGKGKFPEKHIHEYIEIEGSEEKLAHPLMHLNYETISQFIYKLENIYTENEAENLLREGKKVMWADALRMPVQDFLKTYFYQKGYKDGLHGLVLSLLQAFYAEVVFSKLWEKQGFEEKEIELSQLGKELKKLGDDISYWQNTARIEESKSALKRIVFKVRRKTRL